MVEVALHAVLEVHRTVLVLAFRLVRTRTIGPQQEIVLWILAHEARNFGGIDDLRALLFQNRDGIRHHFRLIWIEAAAFPFLAGKLDAVVVKRPGDSDARTLQRGRLQKPGVVVTRWRRTGPGGGIVRIRLTALEG